MSRPAPADTAQACAGRILTALTSCPEAAEPEQVAEAMQAGVARALEPLYEAVAGIEEGLARIRARLQPPAPPGAEPDSPVRDFTPGKFAAVEEYQLQARLEPAAAAGDPQ